MEEPYPAILTTTRPLRYSRSTLIGPRWVEMFTRCATCHMAKSHFHQGLCTPLPVPSRPWDDINMDFIMALPETSRGKDVITVLVDRFSKMTHFITCHKCDDATYIGISSFKKL